MKEREKRLTEVEAILKRSLERNQDSENKEIVHSLITNPVFIKAMQDAHKNTIKGRPEKEHYSPQDIVKDPEFNRELERILKEKEEQGN